MHRLKPRQNTRDISHIHGLFPTTDPWTMAGSPRVHTACTYRLEINGVPLTDDTIATIYTREQIRQHRATAKMNIRAPLVFQRNENIVFIYAIIRL